LKYLVLILQFFITLNTFSFNANDSLKISNSKLDSLTYTDNNFLNFVFYKNKGPYLISNLGTFGSDYYFSNVNYIYSNDKNDFKLECFKSPDLIRVKPFTNISYVNASRKEQIFSIFHNQNFGKNLHLDFRFLTLSSPGIYFNQESNNSNFNLNLSFNSNKQKYLFNFNTEINKIHNQVNGGLANISDFEKHTFSNPKSYAVNLVNSERKKSSYIYKVNNQFKLFSFSDDSLANSKNLFLKVENSYLTQKNIFNDNDPLSKIYPLIYLDSLNYVDSIYQNEFNNKISIIMDNHSLINHLYGLYNFNNYFQKLGLDTSYVNYGLGTLFTYNFNKIHSLFDINYTLQGYNKGDVNSSANLNYKLSKNISTSLFLSYALNQPSLKYVNYYSNHFIFNNYNFKKQQLINGSLGFHFNRYNLQISTDYKIVKNALYYDNLAFASQNQSNSLLFSYNINHQIKLWYFHFITFLSYQFTSNDYIYPLPKFSGREVLYFEKNIFKKALKLQFGVNVSYTDKYYGYAYQPATESFYTQTEIKIGNYPYVDLFLNAHVKRAQIFLKLEHVNAGWSRYNYISVPNYPVLNRSLKFGVSWNLLN